MSQDGSRYPARVLEHLREPRHAGRFPAGLAGVRSASSGSSPDAGLVRLELRLESGRVSDIRMQAFGCGWTIASASWLAEHAVGRDSNELSVLEPEALVRALELPPDKQHCARLVCDCLRRALAAPATPA